MNIDSPEAETKTIDINKEPLAKHKIINESKKETIKPVRFSDLVSPGSMQAFVAWPELQLSQTLHPRLEEPDNYVKQVNE